MKLLSIAPLLPCLFVGRIMGLPAPANHPDDYDDEDDHHEVSGSSSSSSGTSESSSSSSGSTSTHENHGKDVDVDELEAIVEVLEGREDLITDVFYRADGNYKLLVKIATNYAMKFDNLLVGKCNAMSPGVTVQNEDTTEVTLMIDMNMCQFICDKSEDELVSTIDIMNQPIDISFGVKDHDDWRTTVGRYRVSPTCNYHEDYIIEFNTQDGFIRQLVLDTQGDLFTIEGNIQFSYMTYASEYFTDKNTNDKQISTFYEPTYVEIAPTNGFTPDKMLNLPEICFLKDLETGETKMLWDMGNESSECHRDNRLGFDPPRGQWQFHVNFYEEMGYDMDMHHSHDNFRLTCNMRICGQTETNPCQRRIDNCGYTI